MATQDNKKLVSCRQDWHQTSSQVVVTLYARTPLPHLSSIKANRTGVRKQGRRGGGGLRHSCFSEAACWALRPTPTLQDRAEVLRQDVGLRRLPLVLQLDIRVAFEGEKFFQAQLDLWGVCLAGVAGFLLLRHPPPPGLQMMSSFHRYP